MKCVALAQTKHWVWNTFSLTTGLGGRFHVVNVYSPHSITAKRALWNDLREILGLIQSEPVVILGDFNCVRSTREVWKCTYRRTDSEGFDSLIKNYNLLDLSPVNANYTWFGPEGKKSRLDRILANSDWAQMANWQVAALCRKHSDHKPLMMFSGEEDRTAKPLKIFNYFLTDKLLEEMQKMSKAREGWKSSNLQQTLKDIKNIVKCSTEGRKEKIDEEISHLEKEQSRMDLNLSSENNLIEVGSRLRALYAYKESMIR